MSRTVGILLDDHTFSDIARKRTGYEKLHLYQKAARQLKLELFFMSLRTTGKTKAWGYIHTPDGFRLVQKPIPKVIHNRDIAIRPLLKRKLDQLAKNRIVFNRVNRFSKYRIYKLLAESPALRGYLPATRPYSRERLMKAMDEFPSLFIKPTSGSVGGGIMKISRVQGGNWKIFWINNIHPVKTAAQTVRFVDRIVGKQSYLIQETIPLALYKNRPYDIRVSVQRNGSGNWQVTGMVGKVAAPGRHVTNVAKGGKVCRCEELFQAGGLSTAQVRQHIAGISLRIAEYLGKRLPHLSDIGLDIGVDREGRAKFIEMNGRDQRITFYKAGMKTTFYNTYYNPMEYAARMLNRTTP